jgi:hypothetical protein
MTLLCLNNIPRLNYYLFLTLNDIINIRAELIKMCAQSVYISKLSIFNESYFNSAVYITFVESVQC